MIRLLADRNLPRASVARLRAEGFDIAVAEGGASDEEVLDRASFERRVLLTLDRDFGRLVLSTGIPAPSGVVYLRLRVLRPETPAELLVRLLRDRHVVLEGYFTSVRSDRVRQRPLSNRR